MRSDSDSSLYDLFLTHRLKFGFGAILILVLVFAGIIGGYLGGLLTDSEVGVIISGVGALGTLILATITVVSVLETRVQARQREKEQDKYMEERVLSEINSLLETVERNDERMGDPEFYWTATHEGDPEDVAVYIGIEPLVIEHPTVAGYFDENYPEAQETLNKYNDYLVGIDGQSNTILQVGKDRFNEFLEAIPIEDSNGEVVSSEAAISLVLSKQRGEKRSFGDEYPDWWDMEKEIEKQLEAAVGEELLEEFFDTKTNLEITAIHVRKVLGEVRDEILEEYPIQPQSESDIPL